MKKEKEHLENIAEIRKLMEESSRFISLSGASGIFVGLVALTGIAVAYKLQGAFLLHALMHKIYSGVISSSIIYDSATIFIIIDAIAVCVLAISGAIFFTLRKSRRNNLPIWTAGTANFIIHLSIPLIVGGIVCLILIFKYYEIRLIVPLTLIFYGLAVINARKYAMKELLYLGVSEIILGVLALLFLGYGMVFWAIGFGLLHILYGILMHNKYERRSV